MALTTRVRRAAGGLRRPARPDPGDPLLDAVVSALRYHGVAMDIQDIALAVGFSTRRVDAALGRAHAAGLVRAEGGPHLSTRWSLPVPAAPSQGTLQDACTDL